MKFFEIDFEIPEEDYYFASPEADVAEYAKSDLSEEATNLTAADIVLVRSNGYDYAVVDGSYTKFVKIDWRPGRMTPSGVQGLERVKKFGNLIVSTRIIAFILSYFEGIAPSRLYYFHEDGLACLADHLKELEDRYLNENDHLKKETAELFCSAVHEDAVIQGDKLEELAHMFDGEEEEDMITLIKETYYPEEQFSRYED